MRIGDSNSHVFLLQPNCDFVCRCWQDIGLCDCAQFYALSLDNCVFLVRDWLRSAEHRKGTWLPFSMDQLCSSILMMKRRSKHYVLFASSAQMSFERQEKMVLPPCCPLFESDIEHFVNFRAGFVVILEHMHTCLCNPLSLTHSLMHFESNFNFHDSKY